MDLLGEEFLKLLTAFEHNQLRRSNMQLDLEEKIWS